MTDTVTEATGTSITMPVPALREQLTAVLAHVAADDTMPWIRAVRFEVLDGVLYLVATDRYTMGVTRYGVPGARIAPVPDAGRHLDADDARGLLAMLDDDKEAVVLVIRDDEILADAGQATRSWPAYGKHFPDWRKLMGKLIAGEPAELGDDYAVDAVLMSRFAAACADDPGEFNPYEPPAPLKVRVVRGDDTAGPTVLVTRGDWFLGAVMSCRTVNPLGRAGGLPQWDSWAAALTPPPAETAAVKP